MTHKPPEDKHRCNVTRPPMSIYLPVSDLLKTFNTHPPNAQRANSACLRISQVGHGRYHAKDHHLFWLDVLFHQVHCDLSRIAALDQTGSRERKSDLYLGLIWKESRLANNLQCKHSPQHCSAPKLDLSSLVDVLHLICVVGHARKVNQTKLRSLSANHSDIEGLKAPERAKEIEPGNAGI